MVGRLEAVLLLSAPGRYADLLGILDYGTFEVAEDRRRIPILGYVVVSGARVVLVDTGFPQAYREDPDAAGLRDGLDAFGRVVSLTPANTPEAQLGLAGLGVEEVTDVVVTHGDVDHVGGLHDFPHATIVVSRREREGGPPRYFGDARPVSWPVHAEYVLVERDLELAPGLTLLATPGHSPGHLSLLVRLRESGPVLLAGDAISRAAELETGVNGGASDQDAARSSAARLVELAEAEDALLVYGHDLAQWRGLRRVPDLYR